MLKDSEVVKKVKDCKREADRKLSTQRDNTRRCKAFESGDYMEYSDKIQFATSSGQKKRVTVQINKIKPYKNAVKGFLAQNRRKPEYVAQMPWSDEMAAKIQNAYSKYANTLSEYLRDAMHADQVETQQDGDMLSYGIGVAETALTYGDGYASSNPNGDVIMECVDIDTFWYDYRARQTNLVDRAYDGVTKSYHKDDALKLFKDSDEEDFEADKDEKGGKYDYQADLGTYDRVKYDWADRVEGLVNVHFFQWFEYEKYWRADNPIAALQNPQSVEAAKAELATIKRDFDDDDFDPNADILNFGYEVKEALEEAFGEFIEPEEFTRKVYYNAITSGDTCFKHVKSEHQDGFARKVKTGDYDAKKKIWIGMINSLMEPQKYYNKALTELMFVISANSKGGVMVEEDAVEDIEEFEDQYAKTDAVCVMRSGALSAGKVKDKRTPWTPTGLEQIIQIADGAMQDVSGIDKTFLGSSENKLETAALQKQRIRQIVSTMACYVDSIMLYTKDQARLMIDLMRIWAQNNEGALIPIIGKGSVQEFITISSDKLEMEFGIKVGETPITPEEKVEIAAALISMGDKFIAANQPDKAAQLYAMAARYFDMEHDDIVELQQILAPGQNQPSPEEIQQLVQENQQLKSQMSQAQLIEYQASAKKLSAEADLTASKIPATRADTHQKAAQTTKLLEDANKIHAETAILKKGGKPANVTV